MYLYRPFLRRAACFARRPNTITSRNAHNSNHAPPRTIKVLMLHGFTQSGKQFEDKTRILRDGVCQAVTASPQLQHATVDFVFPDAPWSLKREQLPDFDMDGTSKEEKEELNAFTWWHMEGERPPFKYRGLETSLHSLATTLTRRGPFDGVIGFSQGAAILSMLTSLLETGRKDAFLGAEPQGGMQLPLDFTRDHGFVHPQFKFAVAMSGFGNLQHPLYRAFYSPNITTPMLHVIGQSESFIKPEMTHALMRVCSDSQLHYHPGAHVVPRDHECAARVANFVAATITKRFAI